MNYATLAVLIVKHGIPTVLQIRKMLSEHKDSDEVTDEDWEKLEKISEKTYDDYLS
tara:strand:+ start:1952 stop:2119 length:168 start_codon:yes stop_codon:yes gene_type:complete